MAEIISAITSVFTSAIGWGGYCCQYHCWSADPAAGLCGRSHVWSRRWYVQASAVCQGVTKKGGCACARRTPSFEIHFVSVLDRSIYESKARFPLPVLWHPRRW